MRSTYHHTGSPDAALANAVTTRPSSRVLAGGIVVVGVVVVAIVVGMLNGGTPSATPGNPPIAGGPTAAQSAGATSGSTSTVLGQPGVTQGPTTSFAPSFAPSPSLGSAGGTPSPAPSQAPGKPGAVPIVPVADYRSTASSVSPADVRAVVAGTSTQWQSLELVADQAGAVLATLGVTRGDAGARLVLAPDAASLMDDLASHRDRLAFMRADQVGPGVTALAWKQSSLFGVHRVKSLAAWSLDATLPVTLPGVAPFATATTWTMFAAGDIGLDRTVYYQAVLLHQGADFPYDGGTAQITGLTCCSQFGWKVPVIASTGHSGAMRDLITSADLALANMEESAPNTYSFHSSGTVLTGDPALLSGVAHSGIDVVSCASTHIGDGGPNAIAQTLRNLAKYGIDSFGAGPNLAAAGRPAIYEEGGIKVAILGFDGISSKYYGATATSTGDNPLKPAYVRADIAAARAAGADVVIAFPHWGIEYTRGPSAKQQKLGHMMIDAGADLVIGNHPHWAQAMEVYKGRPIWYALGNFTYDQSWSEPTLEGITLELTFRSGTLVQARMNPHILIKAVQPNLLDPAGDGQRVLGPIYKASGQLLPW